MTDSQTPRPILKLSIKPASLESLADKLPKQIIVVAKEPEVATPKKEQHPPAKNKDDSPIKTKQEQEAKPQNKEVLPQVVEPAYDFFEVYGKLHTDFRAVISLKNPVALAIGIKSSVREASGLSHKSAKMWMGEYLRRSQYYGDHSKLRAKVCNKYLASFKKML